MCVSVRAWVRVRVRVRVCVYTFRADNTMSHCSLYLNSLFDTERNNLFMDDRTIEIKLYWLKLRIKSYLKKKTNGVRFRKTCSQHFNWRIHVFGLMLMILLKINRHHSLFIPRRFYLLSRAPFYQMEKYTFISFQYLHILPAHQIFCLNQYFLILGKWCSIKSVWDT